METNGVDSQSDIPSSGKEDYIDTFVNNNMVESDITDEGQIEYESELDICMSPSESEFSTGKNGDMNGSTNTRKYTHQEKIKMAALRKHLDELSENVLEITFTLQKLKDRLTQCRDSLMALESDRNKTFLLIQDAEESGNNASLFRLRAGHGKLCRELTAEEELQAILIANIEEAELAFSRAQVEQGRLLLLNEELQKDELRVDADKQDVAQSRLKREQTQALLAEKRHRARERENMSSIRERERKQRQSLAAAKKSREQVAKYLKETMAKVREKEAEEEEKLRNDLHYRMNSILRLKSNISASTDLMRAQQTRGKQLADRCNNEVELEIQELKDIGKNPNEILMQRYNLQKSEFDKKRFEMQQQDKQVEIASKLLKDEKLRKSNMLSSNTVTKGARNKKYLRTKKIKPRVVRSPSGSSSLEYGADNEELATLKYGKLSTVSSNEDEDFSPFGIREVEESGEVLAFSEFEGLWLSDGPTTDNIISRFSSKMEEDMFKKALEKQKSNLVHKQVVCGREFKGVAFGSKPSRIIFKDFDIGKTYQQKVIITNISYTINSCQLVDVSDNLKDFIQTSFSPTGQLSAGISCDLHVSFVPMVNEDITGEVNFLCQTGPFTIPIICSTKKCEPSCDVTAVDFGNQVLGEALRKFIILTNSGALPTHFNFRMCPGVQAWKKSPESDYELRSGESSLNSARDSTRHGPTVPDDKESVITPLAILEDGSMNDYIPHSDMVCGTVERGYLGPLSSTKLEIIFKPTIPGKIEQKFRVTFEDENCNDILIKGAAVAVDIPICIEKPNIDFKICMYDRLYQESIILNNNASNAVRLKFEVPRDVRNHMEILPKSGFIQAKSSFSAQIKFLPRQTLLHDAGQYFDPETGVLDVPMSVKVVDQAALVNFAVNSVVTKTDLEFDVPFLDFGFCTIYENVVRTIQMTNHSLLLQEYGFLGLPNYVEIQPNDGFGTILPSETVELDVVFKAETPKDYSFEIICKTLINREFGIQCKAVGVYPPLELSGSVIHFKPTALDDSSYDTVHVCNNHTSMNEFTHQVPRAGSNGKFYPVGATKFQFMIPDDCPLSIHPSIGTVKPGEKCAIKLKYTPAISDLEVSEEVLRVTKLEEELQTAKAVLEDGDAEATVNTGKKRPDSKKVVGKAGQHKKSVVAESTSGENEALRLKHAGVDRYKGDTVKSALSRNYDKKFSKYEIPCYIIEPQTIDDSGDADVGLSHHNTLYLEVYCPSVRPTLAVISNNGSREVNFGDVPLGMKVMKTVSIQNISAEVMCPVASALNTAGPFSIINAFRPLQPGQTHMMMLNFTPQIGATFSEFLSIRLGNSCLRLSISGCGMIPEVELSFIGDVFDIGHVVAGESITQSFRIKNILNLQLEYDIKFRSLMKKLEHDDVEGDSVIGTRNYGGHVVFDANPSCGIIEGGGSVEINVHLKTDHFSNNLKDVINLNIFGRCFKEIFVTAISTPRLMYIDGDDRTHSVQESLAVQPDLLRVGDVTEQRSIVVTLHSRFVDESYRAIPRQIAIGCSKSAGAIQGKKGGEFFFDPPSVIQQNGFSIDCLKGNVDVGASKPVSISWKPSINHNPYEAVEASIGLTLKGDVATKYTVLLRALVSSKQHDEL